MNTVCVTWNALQIVRDMGGCGLATPTGDAQMQVLIAASIEEVEMGLGPEDPTSPRASATIPALPRGEDAEISHATDDLDPAHGRLVVYMAVRQARRSRFRVR
jgi:hypothetical protein